MSTSISQVMEEDHRRLFSLLGSFRGSIGNGFRGMAEAFGEFRMELEKHIFAEEKALYLLCSEPGSEYHEMVSRLKEDHNAMMSMLKSIEAGVSSDMMPYLKALEELLLEHCAYEEEEAFPRLDRCLSVSQKNSLISRVGTCIVK